MEMKAETGMMLLQASFHQRSVGKESTCNAGDPGDPWVGKTRWRRDRLPTPIFLGFPGGSDGKESTSNAGYTSLIHELGRVRHN